MKLEEKKAIVEDLHEKFARSRVVILTDYKGLDVAQVNDLRRKLKDAEVDYKVVKNTLLVRAAQDTDVASLSPHFKGPSAVAMSYFDPVAPAKVLTDFAKDNDKFEIKAGILAGKMMDAEGIKALAKLPGREELLGQLLSVMNNVPAGFVRTLAAVPQNFANVLMAIKEQKEGQGEAA